MATIVILTTANSSPWTKPGDWNDSANTVEAIGGGGGGGKAAAPATLGGSSGGGGGGAAYTKATNVTLSGNPTFTVGVKGNGGATPSSGTDTQFKDASTVV